MESQAKFDLEGEIRDWRLALYTEAGLWPSQLDELESHLRDTFEVLAAGHRSNEDAFREAVLKIGTPSELAATFRESRYADSMRGSSRKFANRFFPPLVINYWRTGIRSFRKAGFHSVISTCGLAVALACTIWIGIYVDGELGYDQFHSDADNIVRLRNFHFLSRLMPQP